MQRTLNLLTQLLGLTAAAVALAAGIFVLVEFAEIRSPSDQAAWVQAVGSIAAILVAIWISRGDIQRAKRSKDEEDRALDGSARLVIGRAELLVRQMDDCEAWKLLSRRCQPQHLVNTYKAFVKRNAEEIYAVLAAFPIERLAAIGLIDMVIPVRRAMAEIAAQAFLYNFDSQGNLTGPERAQFADWKQMVDEAWQNISALPART